jgi:fumarylacetoacetase
MPPLDVTHDPARRSWVRSANGHPDFPIQNLPFGVFRRRDTVELPRAGVAIGDQIVDLERCVFHAALTGGAEAVARYGIAGSLNDLMAQGPAALAELRLALSDLLAADADGRPRHPRADAALLVPMADAELFVPAAIGDYSDFYASIHHATNVGSMFRPDNALLPNYKWVPIGYHGRASSIVVSDTPVFRPSGQTRDDPNKPPVFGPSRRLDYELEVGLFIGPGNPRGQPVPITEAADRLFGLCLLNDWSARDLQTWEYQPLGPFLAKSFATTVSPWVVTLAALAPFRTAAYRRPDGDPNPLPYLYAPEDQAHGGIDVTLEVSLQSAEMRSQGIAPVRLSRSRLADLYWTPAQLVAHHTSNGCNLRPGDLLGTGTVSGPAKETRGCLLELTWRGTEPIQLPTGEQRTFLTDGDQVVMRGWCEREGFVRIGLGECRGMILNPNGQPEPA